MRAQQGVKEVTGSGTLLGERRKHGHLGEIIVAEAAGLIQHGDHILKHLWLVVSRLLVCVCSALCVWLSLPLLPA